MHATLALLARTDFPAIWRVIMVNACGNNFHGSHKLTKLRHALSNKMRFNLLLDLFPLLAKKLSTVTQARRVYARYKKPSHLDRNLIVIGAGAEGLVAAYIAAAVKAKVTFVEAGKMSDGCVPSNALIKSAKLAHQMRQADHYGLEDNEPPIFFAR